MATATSQRLLDRELQHAWQQQIVEDSLNWARDVKHVTPERLADFEAGLRQGMGELLATMRLHGYVR